MDKRFWISGIAMTIAAMLLGFLVHGVLLANNYSALGTIMRTPTDSAHFMRWVLLADTAIGFGFSWIYRQGYTVSRPPIGQGLRCGFAIAMASTVPMFLICYAVEPLASMPVVKQLVFSIIQMLILGVLAAVLNPAPTFARLNAYAISPTNMRRSSVLAIACSVLLGCGRDPSDTASTTSASSHAGTPKVAQTSSAPTPTGLSSASASTSQAPSLRVADDGAAGASASVAGIAHDEDIDSELLKNPYILPGPITAQTEPDGLRRIYGAANVQQAEVPGAEGETVRGVILFPKDPMHRAYVYFADDKTLTKLSMVRVMDTGSQWRSAQGIRIGMPLTELVARNGRPFEFLGFDWDYGGLVTDWLSGKLAPAKNGPSLRVQLSHGALPKSIAYNKLPIGDHGFRSDHPQLARMDVEVAEMSLNFPSQDDQ